MLTGRAVVLLGRGLAEGRHRASSWLARPPLVPAEAGWTSKRRRPPPSDGHHLPATPLSLLLHRRETPDGPRPSAAICMHRDPFRRLLSSPLASLPRPLVSARAACAQPAALRLPRPTLRPTPTDRRSMATAAPAEIPPLRDDQTEYGNFVRGACCELTFSPSGQRLLLSMVNRARR
jgi:hypothetical protein